MADSKTLRREADEAAWDFLVMEAEIGLRFAEAAVYAPSTGECLRNRRIAREAYDDAQKRMRQVSLTDRQASVLQVKLRKLGIALKRAGDASCWG